MSTSCSSPKPWCTIERHGRRVAGPASCVISIMLVTSTVAVVLNQGATVPAVDVALLNVDPLVPIEDSVPADDTDLLTIS